MKREELTDDERRFLESITMQVWRARREGALMGSLYTLYVVGML